MSSSENLSRYFDISTFYDRNIMFTLISYVVASGDNDNMCAANVFDNVKDIDFKQGSVEQKIFTVCREMYDNGINLSEYMVINRYKEVYGEPIPTDLLSGGLSIFDIVIGERDISSELAKIREYRRCRKLSRLLGDSLKMLHSGERNTVVDKIQNEMIEISSISDRIDDLTQVGDSIEKIQMHVDDRITGAHAVLSSGMKDIDRKIGGFSPGNLIIVAARPSIGKTQLAINFAMNVAAEGKRVDVYTLEMSELEMSSRVVSIIANNDSEESFYAMINKKAEYIQTSKVMDKIEKAWQVCRSLPLYISDNVEVNLGTIRRNILKSRQKGLPTSLVIFDYLQLMDSKDARMQRQEFVSQMSRGLKKLAKEMGVPIIALSQLNRGVEQREDKRPMLSDLRECLSCDTSNIYLQNGFAGNDDSSFDLLSFDGDEVLPVLSHNVPKDKNTVYRVMTNTGRYVDCTLNHPILTTSGYKKLSEITSSDSLAIAVNWIDGNGRYMPDSKDLGMLIGRSEEDCVIPDRFMHEADYRSICELLQGIYKVNGWISSGIRYSSTSKELAEQIVYLLSKIGIIAKIDSVDRKAKHHYEVIVSYVREMRKFHEKIRLPGSLGAQLRGMVSATRSNCRMSKLNRDTSGEIYARLNELGVKKNKSKGRLTKDKFKDIFDLYPDVFADMSWVLSDHIYWDPVKSISEIGNVQVFDRSVPDTNNFVVNGIIVHNSGAIEQDADCVMMLYRDEFYNADTLHPGVMECIFAKNRHGSTGTVKLSYAAARGLITDYVNEVIHVGKEDSDPIEIN